MTQVTVINLIWALQKNTKMEKGVHFAVGKHKTRSSGQMRQTSELSDLYACPIPSQSLREDEWNKIQCSPSKKCLKTEVAQLRTRPK